MKQMFLPLIEKTIIGEELKKNKELPGVVTGSNKQKDIGASFIQAIKQHRFWEREKSPALDCGSCRAKIPFGILF